MKTKAWTWIGLALLGAVAFFGALNNRQGVPYVDGDIDELAIHGAAQTYGEPRYWGDRFRDEPAPLQASTSSRVKAWWARVLAKIREAFEDRDDDPVTPDPVTPTPDPVTPTPDPVTPPATPTGDNTFLWKNSSESRGGRRAVLLPANLGKLTVRINGSASHVAEVTGPANGNRWHYFLKQTGAAYGRNVQVEAIEASGAVKRKWVVPDGGARWASN